MNNGNENKTYPGDAEDTLTDAVPETNDTISGDETDLATVSEGSIDDDSDDEDEEE